MTRICSRCELLRSFWDFLEDLAYRMSLESAWFARWAFLFIGLATGYFAVGGLLSEEFYRGGSRLKTTPVDSADRILESGAALVFSLTLVGFAVAGWMYGRRDRGSKR